MKKLAFVLSFAALTACGGDEESATWCERDDGPVDEIEVGGQVNKVCYGPTTGSGALRVEDTNDVVEDGSDLDFPQTRNNVVVVFDEATDGEPVSGDVFIDGNKVSIYGNGSSKTIIDGDVTVAGNNARIRGVTITGNLTITLNNAAFVDCVVRGNLVISKNNTLIASTDVYGNLTSTSNNNAFVDNRVQGNWSVGGQNAGCDDNVAFNDDDDDFAVDDDELGVDLTCG